MSPLGSAHSPGGHLLIILTGPSCAGKTPLVNTVARLEPELYRTLERVVPITSRPRRHHETEGVEYYFRSREEVETLRRNPRYLVTHARNDLHAVDLALLKEKLSHASVLYEGNPHTARRILDHAGLRSPRLGIFLSPLSRVEVLDLITREGGAALRGTVTELMRLRLLHRAQRWSVPLTVEQRGDIETRAVAAYDELREAWRYHSVIPNHDGEDSSHWDSGPLPTGDALRTCRAFVSLLRHRTAPEAEQWKENLLPP